MKKRVFLIAFAFFCLNSSPILAQDSLNSNQFCESFNRIIRGKINNFKEIQGDLNHRIVGLVFYDLKEKLPNAQSAYLVRGSDGFAKIHFTFYSEFDENKYKSFEIYKNYRSEIMACQSLSSRKYQERSYIPETDKIKKTAYDETELLHLYEVVFPASNFLEKELKISLNHLKITDSAGNISYRVEIEIE